MESRGICGSAGSWSLSFNGADGFSRRFLVSQFSARFESSVQQVAIAPVLAVTEKNRERYRGWTASFRVVSVALPAGSLHESAARWLAFCTPPAPVDLSFARDAVPDYGGELNPAMRLESSPVPTGWRWEFKLQRVSRMQTEAWTANRRRAAVERPGQSRPFDCQRTDT
jgi:hypothetical protein